MTEELHGTVEIMVFVLGSIEDGLQKYKPGASILTEEARTMWAEIKASGKKPKVAEVHACYTYLLYYTDIFKEMEEKIGVCIRDYDTEDFILH